ncbi:MAG: tetratricopeptide repeat protein [Candidatus Krumholzibacteria bacterium]|nr:tetratricopeptide repeat protein [Candidatus Krumholzibacteria bacterium]
MTILRIIRLASLLMIFSVGISFAQTEPEPEEKLEIPPKLRRAPMPMNQQSLLDLRRRLIELDRLLILGSISRAESLLKELEQHSALSRELVTRRIRLAQLKEDHPEAVRLCEDALVEQAMNPGLWRSLAESQLAIDQPDSALMSIGRFIDTNPNSRSATMVGVDLLQKAGQQAMAVTLIDSMRVILGEPRLLGRQRAVGLLLLDRQQEAGDEVVAELRSNPFNLSLLRTEFLEGPYRPADHGRFLERLKDRSGESGAQSAEVLLAANLLVAGGEVEAALEMVDPLFVGRASIMSLLQNTILLVRELELMGESFQVQPSVDYLLAVLERLAGPVNRDLVLRHRAADQLAQVCELALETGALGDDPRQASERFGELLSLVREVHPTSEYLYSSQIKLAAYTRDVLHEPEIAARRLERLLLNLDLPTYGVALVRLTLGECYLAAGDTARGRIVLDNLGRDPDFRQAAGHAHYHLARLDLAQGHYATARDRFAVVAMDNPGAPYANNSLDLGLAIAEEMDNPSGGPSILDLYSPSVYFDLTARPASRLTALEDFVTRTVLLVDLEEPQHLLERGRFELATLYLEAGRIEEALERLDQVINVHPDGRYPARALVLRGRILQDAGRSEEARNAWERLLSQYPGYLFLDDVRDELRALP